LEISSLRLSFYECHELQRDLKSAQGHEDKNSLSEPSDKGFATNPVSSSNHCSILPPCPARIRDEGKTKPPGSWPDTIPGGIVLPIFIQ
jgi:hypothetical protein